MKTYICEICGDAYIGKEKPGDCPFCGAPGGFIKDGKEAIPIFKREELIDETSHNNLVETYNLEVKAHAIYSCMAEYADSFEVKQMYKRLAKIELEHAVIVTKLLKFSDPIIPRESCSQDDVENFKKTIELENHASSLYARFQGEASEQRIKIFFNALFQAEKGHIDLIKKYLQ